MRNSASAFPMKKSLKIIRFEINNPNQADVNRLPKGIQGDKSLMMWKELCRTGHYETDGESHNITLEFFQNMIHSFRERIAKGVEVPCPKGHNHDPENKRGRVRYLEIRSNDEGGYSLWGIIEFIDPQAKRTLMNSDVSIDSPEELTDGDGSTYRYALEHVAFTDYPVVAGMEGFKDVKFSVLRERLNERWNIDILLQKLGLVGDYGTPSDAYQAIYDKFCALKGKPRARSAQSGRDGRDSEDVGEEVKGERRMSKRRKFSDDELDFDEIEDKEVDFDGDEEDGNMLEMACRQKFGKKKFGDEEIDNEFSEDEEFSEDGDDEFDLDEEDDTELDIDGDEEFSEDDDEEFGLDEEEELDLDGNDEEFSDDEDEEFGLDDDEEFDLDEEEEFGLDDDEDEFGLDDENEFGLNEDEEEEALGMSTRRRKMARKMSRGRKMASRRYGKRFSRESSRLIRENRSMKIDNLRRMGFINAQQSNELKRQFCKNGVSFSRDSEGEFNRLIAFAKRGHRANYRERTGVQFSRRQESNALEAAIGNLYGGKKK